MCKITGWILCLATLGAFSKGDSPPEILRDPSFLRLLSKHYSSVESPGTQWSYRPQEDSYRHSSEGFSHGRASYPYGLTLKPTENSSELPNYSVTPADYYRPYSVSSNHTSYYGYSKPNSGSASGYLDSIQGSHSTYQHQQTRPSASVKKTPPYYVKGKLHVQSFDTSGKLKYKKTVLHQSPTTYKKIVYPRVHKPYAKHKYPMQKTVNSSFRRYYQSPFQRYAIPSTDMLRFKLKTQSDGYYKPPTASPTPVTTERMDDAYPDGSSTAEDYSTYSSKASSNYYDSYEELEKTTPEPEETSYDETTTRGYYGDRIYMSTQSPVVSSESEKTSLKNKYFILRKTSHGDDLETIFE